MLYGIAPELAFATAALLLFLAAALVSFIPRAPQTIRPIWTDWETLLTGFQYIWRTKIVLGAITLDLFAVLLGGSVALLPVYHGISLTLARGAWGSFEPHRP